jgi:galactokinase
MLKPCSVIDKEIGLGAFDAAFKLLYPMKRADECRKRYRALIGAFAEAYGDRQAALISAPGRTEVCGNHTDHQRGHVLAAAIDLDIICVASPNDRGEAAVHSVGYDPVVIKLDDGGSRKEERGLPDAMARGIADWFRGHGAAVGGFNAYTTSDVLGGSGLSSSAAFEVAIGRILDTLYGAGMSAQDIAIAGQYAENHFFGKPCGLMDQMASSVGGFVHIDFADPAAAIVEPIQLDLDAHGLALCVVDTRGDHMNLTHEYAAIPEEMRAAARHFGKQFLREVDEREFWRNLAAVRKAAGDRAALRAAHFFSEDALVLDTTAALRSGDVPRFLYNIVKSGRPSFCYLQNVYAASEAAAPGAQGLSLALALSESILAGNGGAWRVHGGGFAGTIQAFVPHKLLDAYRSSADALFGDGACHTLSIRPIGGVAVTAALGAA